MNVNSEPITKNGLFSVGSHHDLRGGLSLRGLNSVLHLRDNNPDLFKEFKQDITGILDNQERISLIECIRNII